MSYRKIILILCLSIFLSAERNANAQGSLTFSYTGSVQAWSVPCNVTSITLDCYGAQGVGTNYENYPGYGGEARGVMSVLPGEVLYLYVGGQTGWNGGGLGLMGANGGDATDVRYGGQTLANRIIVAGGGGGAGGDNWECTSGVFGNGGGGTAVGSNFVGGGGGEGYTSGSGCGANGASAGGTGGGNGCHGGGGGGGGLTSGGGGAIETCSSPYDTGAHGTLGAGGASYNSPDCISDNEGTGGGGGGYYGGGGAAGFDCGAGQGGGGSSWTGTLSSPFFNYGSWTGNGKIVISYNNIPTPVTDTARVINNVSCNGGHDGEVYARVTGGLESTFTFSWAGGQTRDTATGLSAGTYTVSASDACAMTATSVVTITQPAPLTSSALVTANVLCHGESNGSAQATGIAGDASSSYTYNWVPGNQNTATDAGLSAGSYTVTVTDLCGGTSSSAVTITQPNPLAVSARVTANISCFGASNGSAFGQVNSGTAPYSYTWSPTGGNTDSAVGLSPGTYVLNVVDHNGCTGSAVITITQPPLLTLTVNTASNVNCNGGTDGSVTSTVAGGTTPYTYAWTGGATTGNVSGLSAGSYTLTLTDAHGCSLIERTVVTQPTALVVVTDSTPDNGNCSGSAWVMANGGVVPYTYLWTPNGNRTAYNYGVCHDTNYCCTITDAHGCKVVKCMGIATDLGVGSISPSAAKITVYPNPNSGQFTVENSINTQWTIEVFNVLGEKVYTQSDIQSTSTTINLANQPNGVYLYRVISSVNGNMLGEGKVSVLK